MLSEWLSEWLLVLLNAKWEILQLYHGENKLHFDDHDDDDDDDIHIVVDQHAELNFYSASSLEQQTTGKYVVSLGHFILIPGQPVFALSPEYCVLSCEATYTNFIIFGLIRLELEPTVDLPQDEHDNNYVTNAVEFY